MAGETSMQTLFVISGVSKGLGFSMLKEAAQRGFPVEGVERSHETRTVPGETNFTQLDCANNSQVDAFWERIVDQYPADTRIILINNAGKYFSGTFDETSIEKMESLVSDNLFSSVNMSKGFLNHFEKGTIVNLNSFAGLNPRADLSIYGAAKAAQRHLFSALRKELRPGSFRIMNLHPGRINTSSGETEPGTIDQNHAASWIVDMALIDTSFEISDCTILPFGEL
jgi:short-subunit dehydrogenase